MPSRRIFIPQVAVQIPLTLKGHIDVFEGIMQYMRLHGPWRLYRMEGRPGEQKLLDLKRWGCTGIITGTCTHDEAKLIDRARVPVVTFEPSLEMREPSHPLGNCTTLIFDSAAAGREAAEFFLARHFKHFAFVGEGHGLYWSTERGEAFRESVEAAGATCVFYPQLKGEEQRDWAIEQPRMQAWLKALPKP